MTLLRAYTIVFWILLIDQVSKFYIKTHFILGEQIEVFKWFRIHFIENEGMAWGTEIPGAYGKLILTIFRLLAVSGIGYWLWDCVNKKSSPYLIFAISLILAGAFGNIIDSVFYGVLFNDSSQEVATFYSDNPYGNFFQGKVVDMLYFPFIEDFVLPNWIPFLGGKSFTFFNAIFNFADMAISTGVGVLIFFNKKAFQKKED